MNKLKRRREKKGEEIGKDKKETLGRKKDRNESMREDIEKSNIKKIRERAERKAT